MLKRKQLKSLVSTYAIYLVAILLSVSDDSIAQDMALSDVLIDGEGWNVVSEGYGFTDGAATDADGNFYFGDVSTRRVDFAA